MWKRGEISPFVDNIIFNISLTIESNYIFICEIWLLDLFFFPQNFTNLICGGADISKCFRESLGLRLGESTISHL